MTAHFHYDKIPSSNFCRRAYFRDQFTIIDSGGMNILIKETHSRLKNGSGIFRSTFYKLDCMKNTLCNNHNMSKS
jgi:hypothetical protein